MNSFITYLVNLPVLDGDRQILALAKSFGWAVNLLYEHE